MVNRIPTVSITLYEKTLSGKDPFNHDIYTETATVIDNVVIGQPKSDDNLSEVNLSGKEIAYVLSIPEGDTHDWENVTVEFYGRKWRTVGIPMQYTDGFFPPGEMPWNKKVKVESFNEEDGI